MCRRVSAQRGRREDTRSPHPLTPLSSPSRRRALEGGGGHKVDKLILSHLPCTCTFTVHIILPHTIHIRVADAAAYSFHAGMMQKSRK